MLPNSLDYITIKGFKSIASIEKLRLRPINILVGPNGSGKSNFIGAFSLLHGIRGGKLSDEYIAKAGGAEKILYFGSKRTKEINFRLFFQPSATGKPIPEYSARLLPTTNDKLYVSLETIADPTLAQAPSENSGAGPLEIPEEVFEQIREQILNWRVYHFHDTSSSSPMRKNAKLHDNRFLRADGANIAAFLYLLKEKHTASYNLIRGTIQTVAPFFDDFQLQPLELNPDAIRMEWRHRNSDQYFDSSSLSDGTLRFIALTTLFLQPVEYRPSLILVDEPELGLHPYAIGTLASLIKQASVETQVIVSTQSSLLLDHFQPEDILVAEREGGSTTIRRLEKEPLAEWLDEYSLGQLWEKNELGGRPHRD